MTVYFIITSLMLVKTNNDKHEKGRVSWEFEYDLSVKYIYAYRVLFQIFLPTIFISLNTGRSRITTYFVVVVNARRFHFHLSSVTTETAPLMRVNVKNIYTQLF